MIDVNDILRLSDNKEYIVSSKVIYNNDIYLYLVNNNDVLFVLLDKNRVIEVTDNNTLNELLKLIILSI